MTNSYIFCRKHRYFIILSWSITRHWITTAVFEDWDDVKLVSSDDGRKANLDILIKQTREGALSRLLHRRMAMRWIQSGPTSSKMFKLSILTLTSLKLHLTCEIKTLFNHEEELRIWVQVQRTYNMFFLQEVTKSAAPINQPKRKF